MTTDNSDLSLFTVTYEIHESFTIDVMAAGEIEATTIARSLFITHPQLFQREEGERYFADYSQNEPD